MTVIDTVRELVAIDSVSARSNAEIISYLQSRCEAMGLNTRRFSYTDAVGIEKMNLVALTGSEFSETAAVELALVGHTDVVPYDTSWSEALTLLECDGKLYGRGACDTKAYIAAALTAVESMDLKTLTKPLALVFTSDEEVGCLGAKLLAEQRAFTARYAIVGEPTSLLPMRAGKGYCLGDVIVRGREGHSAYPALGASAVLRAARLIARFENMAAELRSDTNLDFDPPFTTFNIGIINGGTAKNIIAGDCRFTLEWRPVPGQLPSVLIDVLHNAIVEEKKADLDFDCEVKVTRLDGGFQTNVESELIRFMKSATGNDCGTIAFGTEAPQMIELGAEAVVFGPGNIRVAHQTGEFVPVDELKVCVDVLTSAITNFCC